MGLRHGAEASRPKNAPLLKDQPVVTSVFYELPRDSGKEVVLWKPINNWNASFDEAGSCFDAARALRTEHGCVHVQRAGLQKKVLHGVFHTPGASEREGYRVALTARITKPDAIAKIEEHMGKYKELLGPKGEYTLEAQ